MLWWSPKIKFVVLPLKCNFATVVDCNVNSWWSDSIFLITIFNKLSILTNTFLSSTYLWCHKTSILFCCYYFLHFINGQVKIENSSSKITKINLESTQTSYDSGISCKELSVIVCHRKITECSILPAQKLYYFCPNWIKLYDIF